MKAGPVLSVLLLVLFTFNQAHAQARQKQPGQTAQSSLTITATVAPSVWLVMEPDGKRDIVVANAPDGKDSFVHVPAASAGKKKTEAEKQSFADAARARHSQSAAVQFSFPAAPQQLEVTTATVMMDVAEGGKTERQTVKLTTVVAR